MLTVELICNHPPHKCRCRHNVQTEVDRGDLTSNLISNLTLMQSIIRTCLNTWGKGAQPKWRVWMQRERERNLSVDRMIERIQMKNINRLWSKKDLIFVWMTEFLTKKRKYFSIDSNNLIKKNKNSEEKMNICQKEMRIEENLQN